MTDPLDGAARLRPVAMVIMAVAGCWDSGHSAIKTGKKGGVFVRVLTCSPQ